MECPWNGSVKVSERIQRNCFYSVEIMFEPSLFLQQTNQTKKVEILTDPQLHLPPASAVHGEEGEAGDEGRVLCGDPAQAKPPKNEKMR